MPPIAGVLLVIVQVALIWGIPIYLVARSSKGRTGKVSTGGIVATVFLSWLGLLG